MEGTSGNMDVVSDLNHLIEYLILAKEESEAVRKAKGDELTQRENALLKAGEEIRSLATKCKSTDQSTEGDDSLLSQTSARAYKATRITERYDSAKQSAWNDVLHN